MKVWLGSRWPSRASCWWTTTWSWPNWWASTSRAKGFTLDAETDGTHALDRAVSGDYQLTVLDVMLPGISGFDLLRGIRATSQMPVLMLTARGDDVDRIVGLELGADDYLSKPFNPRELVARIRAILRRTQTEARTTR